MPAAQPGACLAACLAAGLAELSGLEEALRGRRRVVLPCTADSQACAAGPPSQPPRALPGWPRPPLPAPPTHMPLGPSPPAGTMMTATRSCCACCPSWSTWRWQMTCAPPLRSRCASAGAGGAGPRGVSVQGSAAHSSDCGPEACRALLRFGPGRTCAPVLQAGAQPCNQSTAARHSLPLPSVVQAAGAGGCNARPASAALPGCHVWRVLNGAALKPSQGDMNPLLSGSVQSVARPALGRTCDVEFSGERIG